MWLVGAELSPVLLATPETYVAVDDEDATRDEDAARGEAVALTPLSRWHWTLCSDQCHYRSPGLRNNGW